MRRASRSRRASSTTTRITTRRSPGTRTSPRRTALGVTTAIIGNCGFTIAPCRPEDRDLTMRNLTNVEGMSIEALRAGIRWDFESFPDYLRAIERPGLGLNVAAFVGHSGVRTFVMREDAPRRAATTEEVARMRAIVVAGHARRGDRVRDLDLARAQRRRRHPDAVAAGRRCGALRAHRCARRGGARRVHAHRKAARPGSSSWRRSRRGAAGRSWSPPCSTVPPTRTRCSTIWT